MSITPSRILNRRSDYIAAIRAMQIDQSLPVCFQIDDQGIGQQVVKLQKYLSTVVDGTTPSGYKFDPAKVLSNIADGALPGAIIELQNILSVASPQMLLSNASFTVGAAQGSAIGTLSVTGVTGSPTFSLNPADTHVQIAGSALQVGPTASLAGSFSITVQVSGVTPTISNTAFLITATSATVTPSLDFSIASNSMYLALGV